MSVHARSTKKQMYEEIERLRTECDRIDNQLSRTPRETPRAQPRVTQSPRNPELVLFCSTYCAAHNTKSVPGVLVRAFLNSQKRGTK